MHVGYIVALLLIVGLILPTATPAPPISTRGYIGIPIDSALPRFDMGACSQNGNAQVVLRKPLAFRPIPSWV